MARMGKPSVWSVPLALCLLGACGGEGGGVDGGRDGTAEMDARVDAEVGLDTGADDTPVACPTEPISGSCFYWGYGATCEIPCGAPEACPLDVRIGWTGNYCCWGFERWTDCRCIDGLVRCDDSVSSERTVPRTTCEFCDGTFGPDVPPDDAGTGG